MAEIILNRSLRIMNETFTPLSFDETHFEMDWTMAAGNAVPPHQHRHADEYFTVTAGEVTFMVNGETIVKQPGDTLLIPKGTRHGISNKTKGLIGLRVRYAPCADTHKMFTAMNYFSEGNTVSMRGAFKTFYVQDKLGWKKFSEGADTGGTAFFGIMNGIASVCGALFGWKKYLKEFSNL